MGYKNLFNDFDESLSCFELVQLVNFVTWSRIVGTSLRLSILDHINDKLRKGIIVRYQPKKIWQMRYEQKLNENDQYAMQSWENKICFHYLCLKVISTISAWKSFPLSLPEIDSMNVINVWNHQKLFGKKVNSKMNANQTSP